MIRTVLSIAFLFAMLATAPDAFSAEPTNEEGQKSTQCQKEQRKVDACTANAVQVLAVAGQARTNATCSGSTCPSKQCQTTTTASKTCTTKACAGETCTATKACTAKACDATACASELVASKTCAGEPCASKACTGGECPAGPCKSTEVRLVKAAEKVDSVSQSTCPSTKSCSTESCSQSVTACTSCPGDELAGTSDQCEGCPGCPMMLASSDTTPSCCGCGSDCSCSADAEQKAREHIAALHARLVQERAKNTALANQLQIQEALAKAREDFCKRLLEKEMEVVKLKAELQIAEQRSEMTRRIAALEAELESISTQLAKKPSDDSQLK